MEGSHFDEAEFFSALEKSGARALLIGRRALIALGMPVLTADYDYWLHVDDIEILNAAAAAFDLVANAPPEVARTRGRYVLENDERVDVLTARAQSTKDGVRLTFDEAWQNRVTLRAPTYAVAVPSIAHLIMTKRWSMRPRDVEDIRYLEGVQRKGRQS